MNNTSKQILAWQRSHHDMKNRQFIIWRIADAVLLIGVGGMLVTVTMQIITRFLGKSLPWTEEMTRNLFVWSVFFGMAVGFRYTEHARVTFFLKLFPEKIKKLQLLVYVISSLVFFGVTTRLGFLMTMRQYRSGEMAPATGIPMFLVTIPIALTSVLAIIGVIQSAFFDKETKETILGERDDLGGEI